MSGIFKDSYTIEIKRDKEDQPEDMSRDMPMGQPPAAESLNAKMMRKSKARHMAMLEPQTGED